MRLSRLAGLFSSGGTTSRLSVKSKISRSSRVRPGRHCWRKQNVNSRGAAMNEPNHRYFSKWAFSKPVKCRRWAGRGRTQAASAGQGAVQVVATPKQLGPQPGTWSWWAGPGTSTRQPWWTGCEPWRRPRPAHCRVGRGAAAAGRERLARHR